VRQSNRALRQFEQNARCQFFLSELNQWNASGDGS